MKSATHGTGRGGQRTTTRVFECFAGRQQRLLAHHAKPAHLLYLLLGVGDDPVPADHLSGLLAVIGDAHGVGKHELLLVWVGLFGQILRGRADRDGVRLHEGFRMKVPCRRSPAKSTPNSNNGTEATSSVIRQRMTLR